MGILNFPLVLFAALFAGLWLATRVGAMFGVRVRPLASESRDDYNIVLTATLTLLGLIIGFTFSMAVSRYDQRKNYEEEETNAIGTEFLRVGLLPEDDAVAVRQLLRQYAHQRVLWYTTCNRYRLTQIEADTASLQAQMWTTVQRAASAKPVVTTALATSGMNDVLNTQGYTQAAWLNRIPVEAWILMICIATCCNLLFGYGVHRRTRGLRLVLPLVLSIAMFLIADIDSPCRGIIRVRPQNLMALTVSMSERK